MPLTPEQRESRRHYIGSSDILALFGIDHYRTDYDVYMSKAFESECQPDSPAIERGNLFEPVLVDHAADKLGVTVVKNQQKVKGIFGAQLDGYIPRLNQGIEAKTSNAYHAWENGVPDHVQMQCQHQMMVFDMNLVHVVALIPSVFYDGEQTQVSMDINMYSVERDDRIIAAIKKVGETWWNRHVIPQKPPKMKKPPREESYKYITRDCNKVVAIRSTLVHRWDAVKNKANRYKRAAENMRSMIIAKLGDGEAGQLPTGDFVTYYANKSGRRTLKYPDKPYTKA